jgi:Tfp pilus assembly protein PilE
MMSRQRGISLINLIVTLAVVGFLGIMAAKLMPAYIEYFQVKKLFATMKQNGDLAGTVRDIRRGYDTRNAIEDVKSVRGEDIEVSKEGGETVITATWSVKVPMVGNASACLDFMVTTAGQ